MSFFSRLFRVGAAEANSALDKLEDPTKLADQGIRELKEDLAKGMQALAEVKAVSLRTKREVETYRINAGEYEKKAMLLLQGAQSGQVNVAEADRLATEALNKKTQAEQQYLSTAKVLQTQEVAVQKMEQNIQKLKSQISMWENEAKSLKARAKVSESTAKINKQLANIDSSGTVAMLERMKEKVDTQEALAESYGQMADANVTIDEEIDKVLLSAGTSAPAQNDALLALKAKMGLLGAGGTTPPALPGV